MSAWSDWRCGALSDEEFVNVYAHERGEDHGEEDYHGYMEEERLTQGDEGDITTDFAAGATKRYGAS